jgi:lysozyme family protein
MSFDTALAHTLNEEKGYANWSIDPGGETYQGITRVSFPKWEGWPLIDNAKIAIVGRIGNQNWQKISNWKLINKEVDYPTRLMPLVKAFYKINFYDRVKSWGFHQVITDKMFDLLVNISPKNGHKIFQRAINRLNVKTINVDGVIGPVTMAAGKQLEPIAFVKAIAEEQAQHYINKTIPRYGEITRKSYLARAAWIPDVDRTN